MLPIKKMFNRVCWARVIFIKIRVGKCGCPRSKKMIQVLQTAVRGVATRVTSRALALACDVVAVWKCLWSRIL